MDEVGLKRKVTLKRKGEGESSQQPKPPQSKWWIWVLSLAIIVVAVVFFVTKLTSKGGDTEVKYAISTVEQPVTTTAEEQPAGETATPVSESATAPDPSSQPSTEAAPAPSGETPTDAPPTPSGQPAPVPSNQPAASATSASAPPQGTVEEKALQVIRGDFGNGVERKQLLGNEYPAIQQRVNQMYRDGTVQ